MKERAKRPLVYRPPADDWAHADADQHPAQVYAQAFAAARIPGAGGLSALRSAFKRGRRSV